MASSTTTWPITDTAQEDNKNKITNSKGKYVE